MTPPWKKPRPAGPKQPLTDEEKALARARAVAAGRRYPNLIDNLWVLKQRQKRMNGPKPTPK